MRLFHFSDDPSITRFTPRPVLVPSERPAGQEWLNGPLVWAIDEWHAPMYFFPRDCPRILLWPKADSTAADLERYWHGRSCRMIAHTEWAWFERLRTTQIYRYELPVDGFEDLDVAGMRVHRGGVDPVGLVTLHSLLDEMQAANVELRLMDNLLPLKGMWETSIHFSGIRLRNAQGWNAPLKWLPGAEPAGGLP